MVTLGDKARKVELSNAFRSLSPTEANTVAVNELFIKIWDTYTARRFPDLSYLEHTLDAIRMLEVETFWTQTIAYSVWYQHSAPKYREVEQSIKLVRDALPTLGVSEKNVEAVVALIRGTIDTDPRGRNALLLADANTYATYGVAASRTNEIVVLKAKEDNLTYDYVQKVIAKQLLTVLSGTVYYSRTMREQYDASTRQNIRDTLRNIKYIGKNNPNRRALR